MSYSSAKIVAVLFSVVEVESTPTSSQLSPRSSLFCSVIDVIRWVVERPWQIEMHLTLAGVSSA